MNEYDLCHFYKVELLGDLPSFPSPCEPATHKMLSKFLLKVRMLGHPNLVVAFSGFCHSFLSFVRTAHQRQPQVPADGAQGRHWWEGYQEAVLLPALYVFGSNDILYMNHIMCRHYHANYRCGQCLNEVFTTGQQLKAHLKVWVGLPKEAKDHTPSSPEKEHMCKEPLPNS